MRAAAMHDGVASRPLPVEYGRGHQDFSWRNYLAHSIEGGCYVGGIAFLAVETVLPTMMQSLGAAPWLIAIMPVVMMVGFTLPSIFTAHFYEHRPRMYPYLMITGIFQRLPYLIGALLLLTCATSHPLLTLIGIALVPFISGICGGVGGPAWMELTSKILPPNRRASAMAIRMIVAAMIGIVAGQVVEHELSIHPGAIGYGRLHLYSFIFLVLSYLVFTLQREDPDDSRLRSPRRSLADNLRSLPALLREHPQVRRMLLMTPCALSIWIVLPFMAIFAREQLGQPEAFVGRLLTMQMIGGIVGNIVGGWVGDRYGGRSMLRFAFLAYLGIFSALLFDLSETAFLMLFIAWGAAFSFHQVGGFSLATEIVPISRRPTALAVLTLINAPGLLVMSSLGGLLQQILPGEQTTMVIPVCATLGFIVVALIMLHRITDPRSRRA